ncbi:hypothetical protein ABW636_14945 [Aquimarina sp. 2201CG1-2-11]|uniref:hypothetical protein n=1 Tax=Aquimarina discodermiae TaxID=3231043 RepID=UPI0034618B7C
MKDEFWSKLSNQFSFSEVVNRLLALYEAEMGIVELYTDSYYFVFFEKRNKTKVYAIFKRLGIQIGDHATIFKEHKPA